MQPAEAGPARVGTMPSPGVQTESRPGGPGCMQPAEAGPARVGTMPSPGVQTESPERERRDCGWRPRRDYRRTVSLTMWPKSVSRPRST